MGIAQSFGQFFKRYMPSPLSLAVILTLITMVLALLFGEFSNDLSKPEALLQSWYQGIWNPPLLVFMVQMLLILVLGHTLALAPAVSRMIDALTNLGRNAALAAATVCFFTLVMAFINWGLGLIFGAILARKMGEKLSARKIPFNFSVLGAAGYAGFMIWHGGISGSAPLKVVEKGHIASLMSGIAPTDQLARLPDNIAFSETIFGSMNLSATAILLLGLPALAYLLAKYAPQSQLPLKMQKVKLDLDQEQKLPSEKIDHNKFLGTGLGILVLITAGFLISRSALSWDFLSPNYINFIFLGLGLIFHGNLKCFASAVGEAVKGASGIIIQFPLYFGIMGIMKSSGLIVMVSNFFLEISDAHTFPLFTFFSAGLVNFFVPSGGGQWAIQGPILIQASQELGLSLSKSVMAMAYGDQITNMLQPFWALPLLGITGLKARDILPHTMLFMLFGVVVYLMVLILF